MRRTSARLLGWLVLALAAAGAAPEEAPAPRIPEPDRVRLAEAFRLAERIGDRIWPGWSRVPFAVVLVTPESEFFIRHDRPPAGARPLGRDALLGSEIFARPRTFPTGFLATFPIEGISTVVVGQPENTAASAPNDWVVTLLHEHFHQLQDTQPGFYEKVAALGLARGDQTAMWMLNFPFPYDSPTVAEAYRAAAQALRSTLEGGEASPFFAARKTFRAAVSGDDRKYWDFQLWKEGVARYTQVRVARFAAAGYEPLPAFAALPGYTTYAALARALPETISRELATLTLPEAKRTVVYPFGAAASLLLDREKPCWRDRYFSEMFTIAPYFDGRDCASTTPAKPGKR